MQFLITVILLNDQVTGRYCCLKKLITFVVVIIESRRACFERTNHFPLV